MKFITEEDLRDLYKIEPFTTYDLLKDTRLTPGARQFLLDRGIDLYSKDFPKEKANVVKNQLADKKKNKIKILVSRLNSINASFLITADQMIGRDASLAQNLITLSRQINSIKKISDGGITVDNLICNECTGIKSENFSKDIGECFEINDFHLNLEKGKEIICLHKLRCELQEIEPIILEIFEAGEGDNEFCELIEEKINQLVNSLSQMICTAFGGEKCQRQSLILNTATDL